MISCGIFLQGQGFLRKVAGRHIRLPLDAGDDTLTIASLHVPECVSCPVRGPVYSSPWARL
jgi:hypothetical protein